MEGLRSLALLVFEDSVLPATVNAVLESCRPEGGGERKVEGESAHEVDDFEVTVVESASTPSTFEEVRGPRCQRACTEPGLASPPVVPHQGLREGLEGP